MTLPALTPSPPRHSRDPAATLVPPAGAEARDLDLLGAHLAGDQLAFHELVERHQRRVYNVCYRYFGDHADAQDATQEAFIALARHGASIRDTTRVSTWLYRVAINACHDITRRRARRPRPVRQEPEDVAERLDRLGERETELDVETALAALDPVSRALLVLVAIEDRSYLEAAEVVGLTVQATKSRIHRARRRLADELGAVERAG